MKPTCRKCGVLGVNLSCAAVAWRCSLCMTKQEHECSCELCTEEVAIVEEVVEEEFIDGVIEFKQDFKLED